MQLLVRSHDIRFSGSGQVNVICALGDITLSGSPTNDSFDLVARYYSSQLYFDSPYRLTCTTGA